MQLFRSVLTLTLVMLLAACASNQRPANAPPSLKIGKPYTVNGRTYYPEYDPHYSEDGIASWYGPGFHGKKTANGEDYDMHAFTAAHKTLPMPSLVLVTNQDNGKTVVVKITDRGPFKAGRIIDLSKAAAQSIGMNGLAHVRVDYLKEETEKMWAEMNITPKNIQFAKGDRAAPSRSAIAQAQTEYDQAQQEAFYDESNVSDTAPIMSVSSNDVGNIQQGAKPASSGMGFISNAEAATPDGKLPTLPPRQANAYAAEPERRDDDWHINNIIDEQQIVETHTQPPMRVASSERISTGSQQYLSEPQPVKETQSLAPPTGPPGSYYIQAGAFSSPVNAQHLASQIQHLGNTAVEPLDRGGRMLHRVRLGPFDSKIEAEGILHKLFELGIKDASLVAASG